MEKEVKDLLDYYVKQVNRPSFIESDPISIPHLFSKKQDIEIAGFFTAAFSWGQRKTIISKSRKLMELMDFSPHQFIVNHKVKDRRRFEKFVHRTFQYTDTLYFLTFLQDFYKKSESLESLFINDQGDLDLATFHNRFFDREDAPNRTRKHIPTPNRKSTCKRINMYLRWMVRHDDCGVDFGIWKNIKPNQLFIPLDVHVDRVARKFRLLTRKQTDWLATRELTDQLKQYDPDDPVKYDFALFGMGVLRQEHIFPSPDFSS